MTAALRVVAPPSPLVEIGKLDVPAAAMKHYYFAEARAGVEVIADSVGKVLGTTNDKRAAEPVMELYGWGANVAPHVDDVGLVYFMPLQIRLSRLHVCYAGAGVTVWLRKGHIYRLNDFASHWTTDAGNAVCLYVGWFKAPADQAVIAMMAHGLERLAAGGRDAPRVSSGFRAPAKWECWAAHNSGGRDIMPIEEAKAQRLHIGTCAICDDLAYMVDHHFPYQQERNRCRAHLDRKEAA